jgi:hypothetical protein
MHPTWKLIGMRALKTSSKYVMESSLVQPKSTMSLDGYEIADRVRYEGSEDLQVRVTRNEDSHLNSQLHLMLTYSRPSVDIVRHTCTRVCDKVASSAVRVRNHRPLELVRRHGIGLSVLFHELINGNHFVMRSRSIGESSSGEIRRIDLGDTGLEAPPGRRIGSIRLPVRVHTWFQVQNLHFEEITRFSAFDEDGPSEDMNVAPRKSSLIASGVHE